MRDEPRNGYYWTEHELQMRRDAKRWRNNNSAIIWGPLIGLLAFPGGTAFALAALVVSGLTRAFYLYSDTAYGRTEQLAPLAIQRLFIVPGFIVAALVPPHMGVMAIGVWWMIVEATAANVKAETEEERAHRLANEELDTRIQE